MRGVSGGTGRVAGLLLALLGLLAMHGLADHGAAGHHDATPAAVSATHQGHGAPGSGPLAAAYDALAPTAPLGDPGPGHTGAALCLAVLLLGLALLVGDRRGVRVLRRLTPTSLGATPLPDGRAHDPPDLARLCVLGC